MVTADNKSCRLALEDRGGAANLAKNYCHLCSICSGSDATRTNISPCKICERLNLRCYCKKLETKEMMAKAREMKDSIEKKYEHKYSVQEMYSQWSGK